MTTIPEYQKAMHDLAKEKGWYNPPKTLIECIALMHSELSEALEEIRINPDPKYLYYKENKPEGFGIELADCVIRIMDTCEYYGIDLEKMIQIKYEYNRTRSFRHGAKTA